MKQRYSIWLEAQVQLFSERGYDDISAQAEKLLDQIERTLRQNKNVGEPIYLQKGCPEFEADE